MKNWFITGGCGFIGRNLIKLLTSRSDACVRVYDNLSVGSLEDLEQVGEVKTVEVSSSRWSPDRIEVVIGDVSESDMISQAAKEANIFVHLAANTGVIPSIKEPLVDCRTNVIGTVNCLEAARQNRADHFLFASSSAPLGEQDPPLHENLLPHPISPYGASKAAGENYCFAYHASYGIPTTVLRFSNVYGPLSGKKGSVVALFIKQALQGNPLVVYGDGTQTRDYLFVEDLARCIIATSESASAAGKLFQVATGTETSLNTLLAYLKELLEPTVGAMEIEYQPFRAGEIVRSYADPSKIVDAIGWKPEVSFYDGLKQTVHWFVNVRRHTG